jgi:hypothetical protein
MSVIDDFVVEEWSCFGERRSVVGRWLMMMIWKEIDGCARLASPDGVSRGDPSAPYGILYRYIHMYIGGSVYPYVCVYYTYICIY